MHDTTITFPELDVETILRTGVSVSYIGENYSFGLYETSSGTILYSLDLDTEWPEPGQRIYPIEFNDLGLHTILSNAYPYCTIKGNGGQDRYITQIAIWAYRQGKESFSSGFLLGADTYGIRDHCVELYKIGREAKKGTFSNPPLLTSTGDTSLKDNGSGLYQSPAFTVQTYNSQDIVRVDIGNAKETGAYVVDEKGNRRRHFEDGDTFYIVAPPDCAFRSDDIELLASSETTAKRLIAYRTSLEDNYERIVGMVETEAVVSTSAEIEIESLLSSFSPLVIAVGLIALFLISYKIFRMFRDTSK